MCASAVDAQAVFSRNYVEADGLPSSKVHDIRPSPSGRPWFATRTGLFEYDGTSWRRVLESVLAPGRDVSFVRFDESGAPWVFCSDGAVLTSAQTDGSPVEIALPPSPPIGFPFDFDVLVDSDSAVVAVTSSGRGLLVHSEGEWSSPELGGEGAEAIVVERCFGSLFVGTPNGLRVLPRAGGPAHAWLSDLPAGPIRGLSAETGSDGPELWVSGNGWVGHVDEAGHWSLLAEGLPAIELPVPSPVSLAADGSGGVIYGNTLVLYHVSGRTGKARLLDKSAGLTPTGVNSLRRDASGLIWGASEVGAFALLLPSATVRRSEHGLFADGVSALAQLPDGRVVMGHSAGLTFESPTGRTTRAFEGVDPLLLASGHVMDLYAHPDGRLYIAATGLGLGVLDEAGVLTWTPVPEAAKGWANSVEGDGEGGVLVGTPQGLLRFGSAGFEFVEGELGRPFVRRIERAPDGTVYLATPSGVLVGQGDHWKLLRAHEPGPGFDHFFTCLVDRAGRVWCGAADGLWRVEGDALVRDDSVSELNRPVYSLVEDQQDRLWIGTDFGLHFLEGERLVPLDWLAKYTGYETNRAAALTDRDGNVWMGSTSGVTVFEPGFELPDFMPEVDLLEILIAGEVATPGDLRLDSSQEILFRARIDSLLVEDRVEFRSRIAGLSEWQSTFGSTVVDFRYAGLPPGRHRFEVEARLPGGPFSPVVRSPEVTVLGPLWTRPWFLLAAALACAGAAVGLYRMALLRRHANELEREMSRRTRELEHSIRELEKTDRLRALGVLGGGIAHDLRNILTVLSGSLSLLQTQRRDSPEEREIFASAAGALKRATQLAAQLQTFATGGAPLTRATSLAALVSDSGRLVMAGSGVELDLDLAEELLPAEVDPDQIHQVFENLLVNARQSQPEGGRVRVRGFNTTITGREPADTVPHALPPGRYVELVVSDDGPGIPAEDAPRIFDPFFTTKPQGSGLGLATAQSIVRRHGGEMILDPAPSPGTTFRVFLPASNTAAHTPAVESTPNAPLPRKRVLIVDDESAIRSLLGTMLTTLGLDSAAAPEGSTAVRLAQEARAERDPFGIVILDLTIPGDAPSPETLARLRQIEPDLLAIASSGYSNEAELSRFEEHGFEAVLPKPYHMADLERALAQLRLESSPG